MEYSARGWFQFVEAPAFARFRDNSLDDDGFAELQRYLASNPEAGDMAPGRGASESCAGTILDAGVADYE